MQGLSIHTPTIERRNSPAAELFPKMSASGMKLLEDEKHDISEVTINDYAYQLNLTVRRLDLSDFGTYTCSAENAYGKADGTIRLQGTIMIDDTPRICPPHTAQLQIRSCIPVASPSAEHCLIFRENNKKSTQHKLFIYSLCRLLR